MADLTTEHGRAQAYASGPLGAGMVQVIEAALDAHFYDLSYQVEQDLSNIKVKPDEMGKLEKELAALTAAVNRFDLLEEDAEQFKQLVHKAQLAVEAIDNHLEDVDRLITAAAQMLAP